MLESEDLRLESLEWFYKVGPGFRDSFRSLQGFRRGTRFEQGSPVSVIVPPTERGRTGFHKFSGEGCGRVGFSWVLYGCWSLEFWVLLCGVGAWTVKSLKVF